jgi:3-oxoacyl-[acyl-carrier protein] reductase
MNLKGRTALVTGSGRGIGRAIAEKLADYGCNIVISDVNEEESKSTAAEIAKKGVETIGLKCDVSKSDQVAEMIKAVIGKFGRIDIVVNNAGITRDGLLMGMKEEDWDLVLNINLKGAFLVTREVIKPMMKERFGRIINIASIVGLMGNAGQANYTASKAGLIALTKTTAREYASRNINVNAVAPGFIETPMTQKLPEKVKEAMLAQIPQGKYGSVEDIANAVLFLASDLSNYVTGQVISVNGGMLMP